MSLRVADTWARFQESATHHPVAAVVYGTERLAECKSADSLFVLIASIELASLRAVVQALQGYGKSVIVNIDACPGLAQDRAGLDYLVKLGVDAMVSTRGHLMAQATSRGLMAIQKVFITDRSNMPRVLQGVASSRPTLVQAMPVPVLPKLSAADRVALSPFMASGFVADGDDVRMALINGAIAVSSSTVELWYRRVFDGPERRKDDSSKRLPSGVGAVHRSGW